MIEMKPGKDATIAQLAISQNLRKEPVNQSVQLNNRHRVLPLATMQASLPAKL